MKFYNLYYPTGRLPSPRLSILMLVVVAAIITAGSSAFSQTIAETKRDVEQEKKVRQFVEAFNARDSKSMLLLAHENIQWLSVNREKTSIETEGIKALQESMDNYFRACQSCKSTLEWVQSAGSRVTTFERAEWTGKNGLKFQAGLAVYEFKNGKIWQVYYFPAEIAQK